MDKKLSFIIISYNEKQYIEEAINSCLQQNIEGSFEIVVGDDGSNDGSQDLLDIIMQDHSEVTYFVMDRQEGEVIVPSLRVSNIIKEAAGRITGEYVIVLSGDDILPEGDSIQKRIDFLEKNADYSSASCNYQMMWDTGETKIAQFKPEQMINRPLFWSGDYLHLSCFLFRRYVLSSDYLLSHYCDDTGLIYTMLCDGKIYHFKDVSFSYRQRSGSIMHKHDEFELDILETLLFEDCMEKDMFRVSTMARFGGRLMRVFLKRKNLVLEKYDKFINLSKPNKYNFLFRISLWNRESFNRKILLFMFVCLSCALSHMFAFARRIIRKKEMLLCK